MTGQKDHGSGDSSFAVLNFPSKPSVNTGSLKYTDVSTRDKPSTTDATSNIYQIHLIYIISLPANERDIFACTFCF